DAVVVNQVLAQTPTGFAVVVSAGNERDDKIHARKDVGGNGTWELAFEVPGEDKSTDAFAVSYPPGPGRLTAQMTSADGSAGTAVAPGAWHTDTLERSRVTITSSAPSATGRGVIRFWIDPPVGARPTDRPVISPGTWKLTLRETTNTPMSVHAWI